MTGVNYAYAGEEGAATTSSGFDALVYHLSARDAIRLPRIVSEAIKRCIWFVRPRVNSLMSAGVACACVESAPNPQSVSSRRNRR